jgi:hypothetical protein
LKFVDQAGIALTEKLVRKFLLNLYNALKSNYRIHPYQTEKKDCYGEKRDVVDSIMSCASLRKVGGIISEGNARTLVEGYTYASILYREYRCRSVHEAAGIYIVPIKFWKNKRPYFVEVYAYSCEYPVFTLEFPSSFLIQCLETCVECAEKAIKGKGLLPPSIWNAICNLDEFEFLDEEGIEEAKPIGLRIE